MPTIQEKLALNGSPKATFETDEDRTTFLIDIPCHEMALSDLAKSMAKATDNDKVNDKENDKVGDKDKYHHISDLPKTKAKNSSSDDKENDKVNDKESDKVSDKETIDVDYNDLVKKSPFVAKILGFCIQSKTSTEIFEAIGLKKHSDNFNRYLLPLIHCGLLSRTIPDGIRNRNQRYYTTEKGKDFFIQHFSTL